MNHGFHESSARALTFCDTFALPKEDFVEIMFHWAREMQLLEWMNYTTQKDFQEVLKLI